MPCLPACLHPSGQAMAGIFAAVASLISLVAVSNKAVESAYGYFGVALLVIIFCLFSFFLMLKLVSFTTFSHLFSSWRWYHNWPSWKLTNAITFAKSIPHATYGLPWQNQWLLCSLLYTTTWRRQVSVIKKLNNKMVSFLLWCFSPCMWTMTPLSLLSCESISECEGAGCVSSVLDDLPSDLGPCRLCLYGVCCVSLAVSRCHWYHRVHCAQSKGISLDGWVQATPTYKMHLAVRHSWCTNPCVGVVMYRVMKLHE